MLFFHFSDIGHILEAAWKPESIFTFTPVQVHTSIVERELLTANLVWDNHVSFRSFWSSFFLRLRMYLYHKVSEVPPVLVHCGTTAWRLISVTTHSDITWTRRSAAACKKFRRKWTKSECVDEQRQCTLLMGIMRRRVAVIVVTEVFLANMYYFSPSKKRGKTTISRFSIYL